MSVTDKFSKRATAASGKDTWNAQEWAEALLLALADWGIPRASISDRDPKLLSDLWTKPLWADPDLGKMHRDIKRGAVREGHRLEVAFTSACKKIANHTSKNHWS